MVDWVPWMQNAKVRRCKRLHTVTKAKKLGVIHSPKSKHKDKDDMHSQNASRSWENTSGPLFWTVVLDFTIRCGLFWSVCATEIVILTSVEHRHGCMNWVNAQINVHGKYLIKNGPRSSETTLLPESHQSPPTVHSGLPSVARGYGQPPVCKASPSLCSH